MLKNNNAQKKPTCKQFGKRKSEVVLINLVQGTIIQLYSMHKKGKFVKHFVNSIW